MRINKNINKAQKIYTNKKVDDNDERAHDVTHMAERHIEKRLDRLIKAAHSPSVRRVLHNAKRSVKYGGIIVDYKNALHSNPYEYLPDSVYAAYSVLTDFGKDYTHKLAISSVVGGKSAEVLLGPASDAYAVLGVLSSFYPGVKKDQLEAQTWLSQQSPDDQKAYSEKLMTYGPTITLALSAEGYFGLFNTIYTKASTYDDLSYHGLLVGFFKLATTFSPKVSAPVTAQAITTTIEDGLAIGALLNSVTDQGVPFNMAQELVAYGFLKDSPYSQQIDDDWLFDLSQHLPDGMDRDHVLGVIDGGINSNDILKSKKKLLADKKPLPKRLSEMQQEDKRLTEQGYDDAMKLGGAITQFGQLVNSPVLVQAGQIFQYGIKIIDGLNQINKVTTGGIFEALGSLQDFGPALMIASSVIGIISLFVSTGPTADEIIIKQLDQIQTGINDIIQNQGVILSAINNNYNNLLSALSNGIDQLTNLMKSEFNQVTDEFYVLSDQIDYYVEEILDEVRRAELAIDEERLTPLKNAITSARAFAKRHPDRESRFYEQDSRNIMRTLEQWASQTVCDRSFIGKTEARSRYKNVIDSSAIINRHFPEDEISLHNILVESGFLFEVFKSLVEVANNTKIQPCNMDLWSQAVTAYKDMVPHSLSYSYDPSSELIDEMMKPASATKQLVKMFQNNAAVLMGVLQTSIVDDIKNIAGACKDVLYGVQRTLKGTEQNLLNNQRNLLNTFIANIAIRPYPLHPEPPSDWFPQTVDTFKSVAGSYVVEIENRIQAKTINFQKPISALMSGLSLLIDQFNYGEVKGLLIPSFPFLKSNETKIPVELLKAEILKNGNITASFKYNTRVWSEGNPLIGTTEMNFNFLNGTQFTVAEITWTGLPYSVSGMGLTNTRIVSEIINAMPFYPWVNNEHVLSEGGSYGYSWTYKTNYIISKNSPKVKAVAKLNSAAMLELINQLHISNGLSSQSDLSVAYASIEAKWRIFKAFAIAIGYDKQLIQSMNDFNVMAMLLQEINNLADYHVNTGVEVPLLEPRIRARFESYFNGVMNQTMRENWGNSTGVKVTSYKSSLSNYVDHFVKHSQTMLSRRNIYNEMSYTSSTRSSKRLEMIDSSGIDNMMSCSEDNAWFSWSVFLLGGASFSAAIILAALLRHNSKFLLAIFVVNPPGYQAIPGSEAMEISLADDFMALPPRSIELPTIQVEEYADSCKTDDFTSGHCVENFTADTENQAQIIPYQLSKESSFQPRVLYDRASWDTQIKLHPYTGQPIFTYRVYLGEREVGTAEFYAHPLFCRSEAGDRHNVIKQTGVLSRFDIGSILHKIDEVCDSVPPTWIENIFSDIYSGAKHGAKHGTIRGASNVVEKIMVKRGYKEEAAAKVRLACYYLTMFTASSVQNYMQDEENPNELNRVYRAVTTATLDTAKLVGISGILSVVSTMFSKAAKKAEHSGWPKTAWFFSKTAEHGGKTIYAYDSYHHGVGQVAGSIAGGLAAQKTVEFVGDNLVARNL